MSSVVKVKENDFASIFKNIDESWYQDIYSDIKKEIYDIFYFSTKFEFEDIDKLLFDDMRIAVNTQNNYKLSDYHTLKEFLDEMTGESFYKFSELYFKKHYDNILNLISDAAYSKVHAIIESEFGLVEEEQHLFILEHSQELARNISWPIMEKLENEYLKKDIDKPLFLFLSDCH